MRLALIPAPGGVAVRPATAWLFPAAEAGSVLGELARHGIDAGSARVAPLEIGLLVIPADPGTTLPSPLALPYGRLAGDVLVPIDAVPNAAVSADEWRGIVPAGSILVWHPAAGMFVVEPDAMRSAADLLRAPPEASVDWGRALPGTAFNGRMLALVPKRSVALADLWGEAVATIGAEPPSLEALPRMPGEWALPARLAGLARRVRPIAPLLAVIVALAAIGAFAAWLGPQRLPEWMGKVLALLGRQPWLVILDRIALVSLAVTAVWIAWAALRQRAARRAARASASADPAATANEATKETATAMQVIGIPAWIGIVAIIGLGWWLAMPSSPAETPIDRLVPWPDAAWLWVVLAVFVVSLVAAVAILGVRRLRRPHGDGGRTAAVPPPTSPGIAIEIPALVACVAVTCVAWAVIATPWSLRAAALLIPLFLALLLLLRLVGSSGPAGAGGPVVTARRAPAREGRGRSWWRWFRSWLTPRGARSPGRLDPDGVAARGRARWGAPGRLLPAWQQAIASVFLSRHDREMRRLLWLLETDPDLGLRYAVPLVAGAGRGLASPAPGLGEGPVDYGARRGAEGGFFAVSPEHSFALSLRYRDLANREISLGRHRRAAFIHAHLLGDLESAASVLAAGGHLREAALLYEEKLGKPDRAAALLESGGHLSEAVLLYERLGDHEKAGDIATRLGQPERAEGFYRLAIERRLDADDPLAAALILDGKLGDTDAAIEILTRACPGSHQASACGMEAVSYLGRLGRHAATREFMRRVAREGSETPDRASMTAMLLARIAGSYPDEATRRLAADQTRLLAAALLPSFDGESLAPILEALRSLEPRDRLLERDARRYFEERRGSARTRRRLRRLVRRGGVDLPAGRWSALATAGAALVAAGLCERQVSVARVVVPGVVQVATRREWCAGVGSDGATAEPPLLLAISSRRRRVVVQALLGFALPGVVTLPAIGEEGEMVVGSHPAFAGSGQVPVVAAMAFTGSSMADHDTRFDLLRCRVDAHGSAAWVRERFVSDSDELLGTWTLELPVTSNVPLILPAACFWGSGPEIGRLCVASDDALHYHTVNESLHGRPWTSEDVLRTPGPVLRLAGPMPSPHCVAASLEDGGVVVEGCRQTRFGDGLHAPHCCFLPGSSRLVAASRGTIEIYDLSGDRATLLDTHRDGSLEPTALVPVGSGPRRDGFAILSAGGRIEFFDVD